MMISDDELYIEDGENFTKNELKSRLHQMEIEYDNSNQRKNYFVHLYNRAIKYTNNREKIRERIERDTLEHMERRRKRIRDTSEDASKTLNLKGRSSKIEKKESENVENKFQTDLNVKSGLSKNFVLVKEKASAEERVKNFIIEEEKNVEERKQINYADLIPKKETILPTSPRDNLSKVRRSEPPAVIESNPITNRKFGISTAKIVVKKISGANLISPLSSTDKARITEMNINQNLQNLKQVTIKEEISNVTLDDRNKNFSFHEIIDIVSDNKLNNEQIIGSKSKLENVSEPALEKPIIFPNKRRTSFTSSISNKDQIKLQTTTNLIENFSKTHTPRDSAKNIRQPSLQKIEEIQNVKYVFPLHKEPLSIETEINKKINGGIPHSPKIVVSSIKTIPIIKESENGMEYSISWKNIGPTGTSLKNLIKYFLAGVACSVIFSGIYYIIKFSPSIIEKLGLDREQREKSLLIKKAPVDSVRSTETSKIFSEGGNINENLEIFNIGEETGPGLFQSLNERLSEFFRPIGRIFEFIINPKKIFYELIIEGLKYIAVDFAWGFIRNNIWTCILFIVLKLVLIKTFYYVVNRRNSNKIFNSVKNRLRNIYDVNNFENGISEEEIVREYSKEYNIKEDVFKNTILPRLKELRKHDGQLKEFEIYVNGRIRTVWQYLGY